MMPTPYEIGNTAERLVAHWLREFGYFSNINTKAPGATDIEARGNTRSLLVQVKAALHPSVPDSLSPDEVRDLTSRAARLGVEPWEARVQLDQQLRQVGEIQWRKLA